MLLFQVFEVPLGATGRAMVALISAPVATLPSRIGVLLRHIGALFSLS
jgi:hypothetical protein